MLTWRAIGAVLGASLLNVTTCRSPGEAGKEPTQESDDTVVIELPKVSTGDLTAREKRVWSKLVGELLAPCKDQPVSLAQCVKEGRNCATCTPAAQFLVKQVQKGKPRPQLETAFRTRFAPDRFKSIDIGDSPSKGEPNAPITIVEWADFQCPFCGAARPLFDEKLKQYKGKIRMVFKQYPLSKHEHAERAARAALAAHEQGKFWELHKLLFQHQEELNEQVIDRLAKEAGLDMKKFHEDLDSEAVADAVAKDRKQAEQLGLTGTPMIFINGRYFDLDHFSIAEDLDDWLKLELKLAPASPAPAPKPAPKPSASAPE